MYNYLLFRLLCFRNCDEETKAAEITLAKYMIYLYALAVMAKKQKGQLKGECFCKECRFTNNFEKGVKYGKA